MMTRASKFDASAPAAGYLYQIRNALLLAVKHDNSSDLLSLEVLDDVAFTPCDEQEVSATEVLQHKHSVLKTASLTDKSVDVWNTLRVWADLIQLNRLDPERTIFTLVTTSVVSSKSAMALLRTKGRRPEDARKRIEAAGADSSNKTIADALDVLNKLKVGDKKLLFNHMFLVDNSPNILEVRNSIEHELRFSVDEPATQLRGFADRLEGWWFRTVVNHLTNKMDEGIPVGQVQRQIRDLLDQFKRDNLPDDLLDALVPKDQTLPDDDRRFVIELRRITDSRNVVRLAQDNHYRAFEQRSKWLRETLIGISEEDAYENRLLIEWANKASIALEGFESLNATERIHLGRRIYDWMQEASATSPAFFIRKRFLSGYMARGSLHMLADKQRLVWHPDDAGGMLDRLLEAAENA